MAERSPQPDTGTPRWVKMSGIVGVVVLLVVIVLLVSGGEHGPGRHLPSDDPTPLLEQGAP